MRFGDYLRLGKISIKNRRKSTRNTVRGVSFALVMLVPIVFFTLSFYVGMTSEVNAVKTLSSFKVRAFEERRGEGRNEAPYLGDEEVAAIERESSIEDIVYGQTYRIYDFSVELGGRRYDVTDDNCGFGDPSQICVEKRFDVVDVNRSGGKIVADAAERDLKKRGAKLFAAGGMFENGGRGEVVISETLAKKCGFTAEEAAGKNFTLLVREDLEDLDPYIDDDADPDNEFVPPDESEPVEIAAATDFKVAGVISEEFYGLPCGESHIYFTYDSLYENGAPAYFPEIRTGKEGSNSDIVYTYEADLTTLGERAARENRLFLALPVIKLEDTDLYGDIAARLPENLTLQFKNYSAAEKYVPVLNGIFAGLTGDSGENYRIYYVSEEFDSFYMFNLIGGYMMIVMYSFGGIILFATLLNLFNTINYSVQVRRNYIGMMRAVGARRKTIPKLYLVEILLIFARSLPWVLAFGGGLSLALKLIVDSSFNKYGADFLNVTLSLNFWYFFAAFALVAAALFLVAYAFSAVACRRVACGPILEVLSDEK